MSYLRQRSVYKTCLALFLGGLVLSAGLNLLNGSAKHVYSDARAYYLMGKNLAYGLGYTEGERNQFRDSTIRVCPLFTAALAGVFALLPDDPTWKGQNRIDKSAVYVILVLQTILYALGAVLVYLIGRRFFGEQIGLWAAIACLVIPDFWTYAGMIMSEPLAAVLLLSGAYALFRGLEWRPGRGVDVNGLLLVAFILLGLDVLVRPNILAPALLLAVYLFVRGWWKEALLGLLLVGLILTPFTVRNLVKHGKPWYATSTMNFNLLVGNRPGSKGEFIFNQDKMGKRLGLDYHTAGPEKLDEAAGRELKRIIFEQPWPVIKLNAFKFLRYWSVARTSANQWLNNNVWWRRAQLAVSIFTNSWLFILGPLGLAFAVRPGGARSDIRPDIRPEVRNLMLSFVMLLFLTAIPMYLNHRHRFAYFPFLALGATALTIRLKTVWLPRLRAWGWGGLWRGLDRNQRRVAFVSLAWTGYVLVGTLVDGLYRFERFMNYIYGQNIYP